MLQFCLKYIMFIYVQRRRKKNRRTNAQDITWTQFFPFFSFDLLLSFTRLVLFQLQRDIAIYIILRGKRNKSEIEKNEISFIVVILIYAQALISLQFVFYNSNCLFVCCLQYLLMKFVAIISDDLFFKISFQLNAFGPEYDV